MSGTELGDEVIRFYTFVFLAVLGSRFALWISEETGVFAWCVRFVIALLVARGLGYVT